ncbi:MAG: hypothetical protein EON98_16160 [Chitinophagaceae bacterium]|nr:MAG: hypothetical protein EON98_16160 [Chitinophagaceae bacterium]
MAQTAKKSVAYSVLIISLALLGVAALYTITWQPSFSQGYIAIPFGRGSYAFSLWWFVPGCFAFLSFLYLAYRAVKSNDAKKPFVLAVIFGAASIVFGLLLATRFTYTKISFGPPGEDPSALFLASPFIVFIAVVGFLLCLLFLKRQRALRQAV